MAGSIQAQLWLEAKQSLLVKSGFPNASLTCYPVGSGNDFVKCFGGKEKFLDLESLVKGEVKSTDIIKVNDDFRWRISHI